MGPPVAPRRWLLAGWAATAALLAGCGERCVPVQRTASLPAPYSQFFGRLSPCTYTTPPPVPASSSSGLTDSFTGSCVSAGLNSGVASTDCETTLAERRSVYNYASLYGFSFFTVVEQTPAGPRLLLRDQTATSGAPLSELTYSFATGLAEVSYRNTATNTSVQFGQAPVATVLTNFQSGGRTYPQVWRITNPLNAAQGRATAAVVLFIDRDYGLIRFDQRDGTSWTLTP